MLISKKGSENLIYLFIWLIVLSVPVFTLRGENNYSWTRVLLETVRILPFIFIFIVNNSILVPKLLFKKHNFQYLAYLTLSIIIISFLSDYTKYIQEYFSNVPPPELNRPIPLDPLPFEHIQPPRNLSGQIFNEGRIIDRILISYLVVGFNAAVKFVFKRQQEEQTIEEQKKMHIQTELSFLKQQISPHFFLNTLNNIHALVDINTDEAKDAIIKLSQLMGYMLYESQSDKIPIQKEMDFVRSYVELMKIRFTEEVDIKLSIPENLPFVSIPPLLSISFIENAFKHGISYEAPSFVDVAINFKDNRMCFEIKNTIQNTSKKQNTLGIGLTNIKKRLNLIYGNTYELLIEQLPEKIYSVKLNIPL